MVYFVCLFFTTFDHLAQSPANMATLLAGRSQSGLSHHSAFSASASASASASPSPHFRPAATPSIYHSNTNASPLSHAHSSSSSSPVPRQPSPILTRPHTSLAQILPTTTTNTTFTVVPRPEPSNTAIYASTADSYSFVGLPTPNPLRYCDCGSDESNHGHSTLNG